jgi:APA family basic amino acid/polyamine antiporter
MEYESSTMLVHEETRAIAGKRGSSNWNRLMRAKPIADVYREAGERQLNRTLGRANLLNLGVGAIIGSGIFVLTGQAAAAHAGPAVIVSFLIAAVACGFAGLCYAELASKIPASGSAYTYAYCTLGEVFAWIMGWLLILEYAIAASLVAVGWSGYVVTLLSDFGITFPHIMISGELQPCWATPLILLQLADSGGYALRFTSTFNLVAAIGTMIITGLLMAGVRESVRFNNVVVAIKVCVLLGFIAVGVCYIDPRNWSPFIPESTTGRFGEFGWSGVWRAAGIIFFAYVGFEAVSTAAAEARNPQRDVPFGVLGSLAVCTALYIAVAVVLTGIVPFHELGVPDPIAVAADRVSPVWARVPLAMSPHGTLNLISLLIKLGAVAGLTTVMLVLCYGQTRIFYSMARDGLLPELFARVHPRCRTPWKGTLLLGLLVAAAAALLPLDVLSNLVSLGTALAFAIVCYCALRLRRMAPADAMTFRGVGGIWTPVLGIITCLLLAVFNFVPMVQSALHHDPVPLAILLVYCLVGLLTYVFYGLRNSRLNRTPAKHIARACHEQLQHG